MRHATRKEAERSNAPRLLCEMVQFVGPLLSSGSHQFLSPKIKCCCYSKDMRADAVRTSVRVTTGPSLFRPSYSCLVCQLTKYWTLQRKRYTSFTDDILRRYTSYKYISMVERWGAVASKAALMSRPFVAAPFCVSHVTLMSTTYQRQTRSDSQQLGRRLVDWEIMKELKKKEEEKNERRCVGPFPLLQLAKR